MWQSCLPSEVTLLIPPNEYWTKLLDNHYITQLYPLIAICFHSNKHKAHSGRCQVHLSHLFKMFFWHWAQKGLFYIYYSTSITCFSPLWPPIISSFMTLCSFEHAPPPSIPRWLCSICGRKSTRCLSSTTTPWPWRCPSCGQARWCPLPGPTPQTQRSWFSFSRRLSLTAGQPPHLFHCGVSLSQYMMLNGTKSLYSVL